MIFFFFNDTATTEIYTLSLHDALPIWWCCSACGRSTAPRRTPRSRCCSTRSTCRRRARRQPQGRAIRDQGERDRKSTRLNSSHLGISYAVFCLKQKNSNLLLVTVISIH